MGYTYEDSINSQAPEAIAIAFCGAITATMLCTYEDPVSSSEKGFLYFKPCSMEERNCENFACLTFPAIVQRTRWLLLPRSQISGPVGPDSQAEKDIDGNN